MHVIDILTVVAALGAGLVAGIFFAFSTFVMHALSRLPQEQGIAAMQAINVTVLNPWFLVVFLGTAAMCLPIAYLALEIADVSKRACMFAGCACYVLGCFGVTAAFNVPLNDQLAATESGSSRARELWAVYLSRWTMWNHVRTAASLTAAALFIIVHVD